MAKARRGRPPKAASERRANRVVIKLTDGELTEWTRQAKARGQDMTVMVREAINAELGLVLTRRGRKPKDRQ